MGALLPNPQPPAAGGGAPRPSKQPPSSRISGYAPGLTAAPYNFEIWILALELKKAEYHWSIPYYWVIVFQ